MIRIHVKLLVGPGVSNTLMVSERICVRWLGQKGNLFVMIKIAKFGGSSVADAKHFRQIKKIVDVDPSRRFVVVSACGRRYKSDAKVTDLLYLVAAHVRYHVSCDDLLEDIGKRYFDIAEELGLNYPIHEEFAAFAERARAGKLTTEELVSRGEYFTAQLMAEYLGLPFLDAADVVAFHHDGSLSMTRTHALIQERGIPGGFVMPGFYGATREGQIKLLDRGGGDISGSILAKCLDADLYENWTDAPASSPPTRASSSIPSPSAASRTRRCASFRTWARASCTRRPYSPSWRRAFPSR